MWGIWIAGSEMRAGGVTYVSQETALNREVVALLGAMWSNLIGAEISSVVEADAGKVNSKPERIDQVGPWILWPLDME